MTSGIASRTSRIALISRSSPVGTPPASTTTSACSVNERAPSTPAISSARGVASAVWKSMNVMIAGPPPAASAMRSPLIPVSAKTL